jgi:Fur family ferric uptake transcriptional regulator
MELQEGFIRYLKDNRYKQTKERLDLIGLLSNINSHFDADGLYEKARTASITASRASVYRTIALLKKSGLLNESIRQDGKALYEISPGKQHHDHLICVNCGRIEEFTDDVIEKHQEQIGKKYNFLIKEHRLEIRGYCSRCRRP